MIELVNKMNKNDKWLTFKEDAWIVTDVEDDPDYYDHLKEVLFKKEGTIIEDKNKNGEEV